MSDSAAPWWAEVQHLQPREDLTRVDRAAERRRTGRFQRAVESGSIAAVATAVAVDEVPRLDEIAWHDFVDAQNDVEEAPERHLRLVHDADAPVEEEHEAVRPFDLAQEPPSFDDPLAALDWELETSSHRTRDPRTGHRTVKTPVHVDRSATAPVEDPGFTDTPVVRRREEAGPADLLAGRPDRVAMWAFILGVLLMIVAAFGAPEADAATLLLTQ